MEAEKQHPVKLIFKRKGGKAIDVISARRTPEQVVALSGSIGSGLPEIADSIVACFQSFGYLIHRFKASDLILESIAQLIEKGVIPRTKYKLSDWSSESERINSLQDMGDFLRKDYGNDIVSQLFIDAIAKSLRSLVASTYRFAVVSTSIERVLRIRPFANA